MKWKESDFSKGISNIKAVLIYGPDAGQIDELSDKAVDILSVEKDNIFTVDSDELSEKQNALFAEACTPSMFGGQKMIIISNAGDSDAKIIKELVEQNGLGATVIVTGGDLRSGGSLRTMFENGSDIAAIACYTDDAKTLETLIRNELFTTANIKQISPDAMSYMITHLGGDRGITHGFLNKIALYVDDKKTIELEDVEKCLPDTGASNVDDFLYSLTAGHLPQTMLALDRLLYDNAEPNMLIRMLDKHFKSLLTAVVDGQLPSHLFWKVADKFKLATKIWPESEISAVLIRLNELEAQLRTTGMPAEILLRDFSLKLALKAYKLSIKRRN
ncbi:MAG: DNA polymerase III subunit delta [Alphaproteobacteria bacterium]|nr:DNA polymerase III subunit delta [Alphaproteobacteria bacterium]